MTRLRDIAPLVVAAALAVGAVVAARTAAATTPVTTRCGRGATSWSAAASPPVTSWCATRHPCPGPSTRPPGPATDPGPARWARGGVVGALPVPLALDRLPRGGAGGRDRDGRRGHARPRSSPVWGSPPRSRSGRWSRHPTPWRWRPSPVRCRARGCSTTTRRKRAQRADPGAADRRLPGRGGGARVRGGRSAGRDPAAARVHPADTRAGAGRRRGRRRRARRGTAGGAARAAGRRWSGWPRQERAVEPARGGVGRAARADGAARQPAARRDRVGGRPRPPRRVAPGPRRRRSRIQAEALAAARAEVLAARREPGVDPEAADRVLHRLDLRTVLLD